MIDASEITVVDTQWPSYRSLNDRVAVSDVFWFFVGAKGPHISMLLNKQHMSTDVP